MPEVAHSPTGPGNRPPEPLTARFARYIPDLLIERLLARGHAVDGPSLERFDCAVMFADISGFTPLTEAFAAEGPAGAETLTRILNDYFGRLIDLVRAHGGDVVKFAGDALTIIWRATDDDLAMATRRAAQCALAIQDDVRGFSAHGHPLSLRIAVGAGRLSVIHIGGEFNRWEFAIAGEPLHEVGAAGEFAEPGEVVLSGSAWEHIEGHASGRRRADGNMRHVVWLEAVESFPPRPAPALPEIPEHFEAAMRGYLPAAITRRIMAGHTGFLGELRTLTILFINLPDIRYDTSLELGQRVMNALQKALYFPWEGSINKLSVDDKGVSLIACLGMPPFSHEDDAVRGVMAALAMHEALEALGQRSSIGVTTGRVYCGSVGSELRQEYTIMGDKVNLSARLMQRAAGGILVDEDTERRSRDAVRFSDAEQITVKGKADPVTVYRPLGAVQRAGAETRATGANMIGRDRELANLMERAERLLEHGESHVVIIEGEAGMGKSCLLGAALERLETLPCRILAGAAGAVEQQTAWFAWQGILSSLLELDRFETTEEKRVHVTRIVEGDREIAALAPLLNAILPLEIPETELTRQMAGDVRAGNTRQLVTALLRYSATRKPLVLVIDDVHWMDSASWALLDEVCRAVHPMLTVLLTRPMDQRAPAEYRALLAGGASHLGLERLPIEETVTLAARRLGVDALPEAVAREIRERAEGHPFFAEEIALALRDSGVIEIDDDGQCRLAGGAGDLDGMDLPGTVEGTITARIDRLVPDQQLAMKVASVIGRVFSQALLQEIYPVAGGASELHDAVAGLAELALIHAETPEPNRAWSFNHIITQQVAYDLMLYSQRKALHEAIARWYETRHAEDLAPYYPVLAHHWASAEDESRQLGYLELAAQEAVRSGANREALEFIAEIERITAGRERDFETARRAHWFELAGEAQRSLGRLPEARTEFAKALELLGFPVPRDNRALAAAVAREVAIQIKHRTAGVSRRPLSAELRERLLLAATIWDRLFVVYFFANDIVSMMHTGLVVTNLSERVGEPSSPMARGYVCLALAMSAIGRQRWVDFYERRALETLDAVEDNLAIKAWADVILSVIRAGEARWDEIEYRSQEALTICRQLGDHRAWEEAAANLALIRTIYGNILARGGLYEEVLTSGRRRGSIQAESWGHAIGSINCHMAGDLELLDQHLDAYAEILASGGPKDPIARLEGVSLLAQRALRKDDAEELEARLQEGMALIEEMGRPAQYRNLPAAQQFTEAIIEAWRRARGGPGETRHKRRLRKLLKHLATYASIFPIGVPRLAWLRGKVAWYRGQRRRALALWRETDAEARRLHLPYEELLANLTLSRALPDGEARRHHGMVAEQLRTELGVSEPLEIPVDLAA